MIHVSEKAISSARALVEAYEAGVAQRDDVNPGEVLIEMIARAIDEEIEKAAERAARMWAAARSAG